MKKIINFVISLSLMFIVIRLFHTIGVLTINPTFYFEWGFYIVPLYVEIILIKIFVEHKRYTTFQTILITTFFTLVLLKILSVVSFSWWYVYLPMGIEIVLNIIDSIVKVAYKINNSRR